MQIYAYFCDSYPNLCAFYLQAAIIMGEVNGVWADYKTQVDDPFLVRTPFVVLHVVEFVCHSHRKRIVNCRGESQFILSQFVDNCLSITLKKLTVCVSLWVFIWSSKLGFLFLAFFLAKFFQLLLNSAVLQSRGVFSGPANMSRLKAQLSLDTNKLWGSFIILAIITYFLSLNISTIRRYIVSDLRQESNFSPRPSKKERPLKERVPQAKVLDLSYKGLVSDTHNISYNLQMFPHFSRSPLVDLKVKPRSLNAPHHRVKLNRWAIIMFEIIFYVIIFVSDEW